MVKTHTMKLIQIADCKAKKMGGVAEGGTVRYRNRDKRRRARIKETHKVKAVRRQKMRIMKVDGGHKYFKQSDNEKP